MRVFLGDWVALCAARLFVSLGNLHNEWVYSAAPSFQLLACRAVCVLYTSKGGLSHRLLPTFLPILALSPCFLFWLKITNIPLHPVLLPHTRKHTIVTFGKIQISIHEKVQLFAFIQMRQFFFFSF